MLGHFKDKCFQAINCIGTDDQKNSKQNTTCIQTQKANTNKCVLPNTNTRAYSYNPGACIESWYRSIYVVSKDVSIL